MKATVSICYLKVTLSFFFQYNIHHPPLTLTEIIHIIHTINQVYLCSTESLFHCCWSFTFLPLWLNFCSSSLKMIISLEVEIISCERLSPSQDVKYCYVVKVTGISQLPAGVHHGYSFDKSVTIVQRYHANVGQNLTF